MTVYGLIGYPLGHSFSKRYFTEKFAKEGIENARYELFPIEQIGLFPALIAEQPDLRGLNVTIPYKQAVLPYLDELDDTAAAVGAVNTIRISPDGRLKGFNTDVIGFGQSLSNIQAGRWARQGLQALVLGTGGAAKAVVYILEQAGIAYRYVSRVPRNEQELSYDQLSVAIPSVDLIVNTTPLGMAPNTDACPPLPYPLLGARHLVFDLVYNPTDTLLMQKARSQGAAVQNGLDMLHLQAEAAWDIWQKTA